MKKFFYTMLLMGTLLASFSNLKAAHHITSVIRYDTLPHPFCYDSAYFYITTDLTGLSFTPYYVLTYFGDGDSDITYIDTLGGSIFSGHRYTFPGVYTVRHILVNDSIWLSPVNVDTVMETVEIPSFCSILPVKFFYDNGVAGVYEPASDPFFKLPLLIEVSLNGIPEDTVSCTSGLYYPATGIIGNIYTFRIVSMPPGMVLSYPGTGIVADTISTYSDSYPAKYFGIKCSGATGSDLSVHAVTPVSGINDQYGNIYVINYSCSSVTATVTLNVSNKYHSHLSADPTPLSISGNTIVWSLSNLTPESSPMDLHYQVLADPGALAVGDTVHEHVSVTPVADDLNPSDNAVERVDTVKAGCDPNEMWVSPTGYISAGTKLTYTINFENTGNDTAFNISVYDILSDNVDIKSLRLVLASAVMNIAVKNDGGHNIVKFDLPHINLLDSSHHGQCDGAIIFTINAKPGLPDGTKIDNEAGIYFDYNPVVETNTVENIIGTAPVSHVGVSAVNSNSNVAIYPNPTSNELSIQTNQSHYNTATISNTIGQLMMTQQLNAPETKVNISKLPAGIYYITLRGEDGITVKKFEKL